MGPVSNLGAAGDGRTAPAKGGREVSGREREFAGERRERKGFPEKETLKI